jgi:hypothetical protein
MFDNEPPSSSASDDSTVALVDRLLAIAHLPPGAHVAVIGRRTLPILLALLQQGCACVRSLRPGEPSPDCESADLAWIVNARSETELDDALRAARSRAGDHGRIVVEGRQYGGRDGLVAIPRHASALGLDVVSFDHVAQRLVFAAHA